MKRRDGESADDARSHWQAIGAIAGLIGAGATLLGVLSANTGPTPRAARLEVTDVVVDNSTAFPNKPQRIEIALHNVGTRRSIVKRAVVRVDQVRRLKLCYTQGELGISQNYSVQLPVSGPPNQAVQVPLHQQLGPDEADRFTLTPGVSSAAGGGPTPQLATYLYVFRLDISLVHDKDPRAAEVGPVIFAVPSLPEESVFYWSKHLAHASPRELLYIYGPGFDFNRHKPCWRANTLALERILATRGARSPELARIGSELTLP